MSVMLLRCIAKPPDVCELRKRGLQRRQECTIADDRAGLPGECGFNNSNSVRSNERTAENNRSEELRVRMVCRMTVVVVGLLVFLE